MGSLSNLPVVIQKLSQTLMAFKKRHFRCGVAVVSGSLACEDGH